MLYCFFFKQKTAYEMRISDWSSDVCSSDLRAEHGGGAAALLRCQQRGQPSWCRHLVVVDEGDKGAVLRGGRIERRIAREGDAAARLGDIVQRPGEAFRRRRDLNARLAVGTVVDDDDNGLDRAAQIGRAHVCTPVTNAQLVCRLLLEKKKTSV